MKAAVVGSFSEPPAVEEEAVPSPAGHQVLVRMETSGLCHTDIRAARGDRPVRPSRPSSLAMKALAPPTERCDGAARSCCGAPGGWQLDIPVFDAVLIGAEIIGSIVGTREDLAEVFRLHRLGRTRVVRESRGLDDINTSIAELPGGEVAGRLVFDMR